MYKNEQLYGVLILLYDKSVFMYNIFDSLFIFYVLKCYWFNVCTSNDGVKAYMISNK